MGENDAGRRYGRLKTWFQEKEKVLVALSGGGDSSLVLKAAVDALGPGKATAALAVSASLPRRDRVNAEAMGRELGVEVVRVHTREMEDPRYLANPPLRCYHCRTGMMKALREEADRRGIRCIVEGSTADDRGDYRPGARAMAEGGAESPLVDLGFSKADVRDVSAFAGLETAALPSGACLASRIPYGESITEEKLKRIDRAEDLLRGHGFKQVRVRLHADVARIEVAAGDIERLAESGTREEVHGRLRDLGIRYVAIDMAGYRQGSLNEALEGESSHSGEDACPSGGGEEEERAR
jgi:uncharacterized protein